MVILSIRRLPSRRQGPADQGDPEELPGAGAGGGWTRRDGALYHKTESCKLKAEMIMEETDDR